MLSNSIINAIQLSDIHYLRYYINKYHDNYFDLISTY